MNIRPLTAAERLHLQWAERERLAYVENHPDARLLGELVDAQHDLGLALDEIDVLEAQ
jgi:hypothetical protein